MNKSVILLCKNHDRGDCKLDHISLADDGGLIVSHLICEDAEEKPEDEDKNKCLIDATDEHILVLYVAMYSRTSSGPVAGLMTVYVQNALIVEHLGMNGQELNRQSKNASNN